MEQETQQIADATNASPADITRIEVGRRRTDQLVRYQAFVDAKEAEEPAVDPGPWKPIKLWRGDQTVTLTALDDTHEEVEWEDQDGEVERVSPEDAFTRLNAYILRGFIADGLQPPDVTHLELVRRAMLDLAEDTECATFLCTEAEYRTWKAENQHRMGDDQILDAWPVDDPMPVQAYTEGPHGSTNDWMIVELSGDQWLVCELAEWA